MRIPAGDGIIRNRQTTLGQVQTDRTTAAVQNFGMAMDFVDKYKQQKDSADFQEAVTQAEKRKLEWKSSNFQRKGREAEGLTEDYLKFSEEIMPDLTEKMSGQARKKFADWHNRETEQDKFRVIGYQKEQDDFVKKNALTEGLTLTSELIRQDPKGNWAKAYQDAETHLSLGLESGAIRPEEFEKVKTEQINSLRGELGKNYYAQDKHDFVRNIDKFGFGKPEKAAYMDRYQRDLRADEREKKVMFQEEKNLIMGQVPDMEVQAKANSDTSFFKEKAEKLKAMGYPEHANSLIEKAATYDQVIGFNEETKSMPLIEKYRAASELKVGPDLDQSSIQYKSMMTIQREVDNDLKQYRADPAEYVSKQVQGSTPAQIASSRISLQKTQGVMPDKGYQVLPLKEQKQNKAVWDTATVEGKVTLVKDMFKYGEHTGKAMVESGLNRSLQLVQHFPADDKGIELLVAGVSEKPVTLDGSNAADYSSANKNSAFHQMNTEIQAMFPVNESFPQTTQDIDKAMTGISARMVDPKAGGKFFDERLTILNEGDKKVHAPKKFDEDDLSDVLDYRKRQITGTLGDNYKARSSMRETVWINSPTGFVLMSTKTGLPIDGSDFNLKELDTLQGDANERRKIVREKMKYESEKNLIVQNR